ncbi:MAG: hypothetical protein E7644_05705 [Ruminococcaceae bacterium]|nr:hypothetical protein [Oscillospiraceae bacterium]
MNVTLQKELKAYQKSIRKKLPFLNKNCRLVLRDFFCEMENYAVECPDASIAEIKEKFGSPEAVAASLLSDEKAAMLKKQNKRVLIAGAALLLLVVMLSVMAVILGDIYLNEKNYHRFDEPEAVAPSELSDSNK